MFTEAATDDIRRSEWAMELLESIKSYLHSREHPLPTIDLQGHEYPSVYCSEIRSKGIFGDVLIGFYDDFRSYAGKAIKLAPGNSINYIVLIKVNEMGRPKDIYYSLTNTDTKNTFLHEIQHVLDLKRRKGELGKKPERRTSEDGTPLPRSEEEIADYYNSAAELNAYFHNVAEPILERIRFGKKHGAQMMLIYPDIEDNFRDYFINRVVNMKTRYSTYWKYLTDYNKRKVTSRLSKLFEIYKSMLDTIKEKDNQPITEQIKQQPIKYWNGSPAVISVGINSKRAEIIGLAKSSGLDGPQLRGVVFMGFYCVWQADKAIHDWVITSFEKEDEFDHLDTPEEHKFQIRVNPDNSIVYIGNPDLAVEYIPNFTTLFDKIDLIGSNDEYEDIPYNPVSQWGLPARQGGWSYIL